jgi:hypothetical protein
MIVKGQAMPHKAMANPPILEIKIMETNFSIMIKVQMPKSSPINRLSRHSLVRKSITKTFNSRRIYFMIQQLTLKANKI